MTLSFFFVHATFRSGYAVSSAKVAEKEVQNVKFFVPPKFGQGPQNFCETL